MQSEKEWEEGGAVWKVWKGVFNIQPDQIYMTVLFWYLAKSDASVRYCTVAYTRHVKFYKVPEKYGRPCITGQPV